MSWFSTMFLSSLYCLLSQNSSWAHSQGLSYLQAVGRGQPILRHGKFLWYHMTRKRSPFHIHSAAPSTGHPSGTWVNARDFSMEGAGLWRKDYRSLLNKVSWEGFKVRTIMKMQYMRELSSWCCTDSFVTSRVLPTSSHSFIVSTVFVTENRILRGLRGLFNPAWRTAQS